MNSFEYSRVAPKSTSSICTGCYQSEEHGQTETLHQPGVSLGSIGNLSNWDPFAWSGTRRVLLGKVL